MTPDKLIRRPDGSYVDFDSLSPKLQLAHQFVEEHFPKAEEVKDRLIALKKLVLDEMRAYREMMLRDHGVKVGGTVGNLTLKTVDGRRAIKMTIQHTATFGPELEAAKVLIDEYLQQEMAKGGSEDLHKIVTNVFRLNKKNRLDTKGILGLRDLDIKDEIWLRAMDAIQEAICRDSSTTYLNFFECDPDKKSETRLPLELAGV